MQRMSKHLPKKNKNHATGHQNPPLRLHSLNKSPPCVCVCVPIFRIVDRWMAGWNLGLFFFSFFFGVRPSITCTPLHIIILKKGLHHHQPPPSPPVSAEAAKNNNKTYSDHLPIYVPADNTRDRHPSIHASIQPMQHGN